MAGLEASVDLWSLHDWVVIDGKTGLVRGGILGHQRASSDTWKGRGLWMGGPGLIYLETVVAGYTEFIPILYSGPRNRDLQGWEAIARGCWEASGMSL